MKSIILLAPLLAAGAWYSGAFESAPALPEDERRKICAELDELFLTEGVVGERLGSDTDAAEATAMIGRGHQIDAEMRRHNCEQFEDEKQAQRQRKRAERAAKRELERGRAWGEGI